ncbi:hypothetical protein [Arthrobacter sp. ok362]|uniref:hypothetical protein n=1 Tax=Arthrobacter sp. ok362 TaxID=1761745 RepID=UPI00088A1A72|nr:hypothetical protein [Arthrobacter sp. ok362]SDK80376.1 hypothetical protein SAMN04487913_103232 [Arthrobacter sp. ok362]
MSESYIRAEIVRTKWSPEDWFARTIGAFLSLALITLVLFWFVAAWFPELGLTYWQLVLPVFAFRFLISRPLVGRQLK